MAVGHPLFQKGLVLYFPKRFNQLRNKMHLSEEDMASKLGITLAVLRQYESARICPTLEFLKHIENVTGVDWHFLIKDEGA